MDYRFAVKQMTIEQLIGHFEELCEQLRQNQEDYSLEETIGQKTQRDYDLVRNEIIERTKQ